MGLFNFHYEKPGPGVEESTPRKTGFARFFELLGRDLWSFYKASILCCIGFFPGVLGITFGVLGGGLVACLISGLVGGIIAAPFLCGMFDTLLRALRDEPGYWWQQYKKAWAQNWRASVVPGALFGLFMGLWCGMVSYYFSLQTAVPISVWVCLLLSVVLASALFTFMFAQLTLVELSFGALLRNSGLFLMGVLPRSLACAAVLCVYWGLLWAYLPYSFILIFVTGFWFPTLLALMIIYPSLDKNLHLEEAIRKQRNAEMGWQQPDDNTTDGGPKA